MENSFYDAPNTVVIIYCNIIENEASISRI